MTFAPDSFNTPDEALCALQTAARRLDEIPIGITYVCSVSHADCRASHSRTVGCHVREDSYNQLDHPGTDKSSRKFKESFGGLGGLILNNLLRVL